MPEPDPSSHETHAYRQAIAWREHETNKSFISTNVSVRAVVDCEGRKKL